MSRKGENIYLRKDGRWEGRYIQGRKPDGRPKFVSIYGKQYKEVKRQLILIKSKLCQKETTLIVYGNGSFEDWVEYWLEMTIRPHIKLSTYAGYRRNIERHLYPYLGKNELKKISSEQIQTMIDQLQMNLAASTLRGICRLLRSILHSAWCKGMISSNPYRDIRVPKAPKKTPRVLTQQEQKKLEKHLLQKENNVEYLLSLYTGLRVGEICGLCWEDIDFENQLLHVQKTVQRVAFYRGKKRTQLISGSPKSQTSMREIPLPAFLLTILKKRKEKNSCSQTAPVFPGRKKGYRDPRIMQKRISTICHSLGIHGIHMHTLRHTFATRCLEKGIGYEVLCELLGHSSPQITLRYYAHCTPQTKRDSVNRLCPCI